MVKKISSWYNVVKPIFPVKMSKHFNLLLTARVSAIYPTYFAFPFVRQERFTKTMLNNDIR